MSTNYLNPFSKLETIDLKNITDEDKTPIYHIKIKNLSLNDIFIDDHNHYWSISQELLILNQNRNPLTNIPFEINEWNRIINAIEWYKEDLHLCTFKTPINFLFYYIYL